MLSFKSSFKFCFALYWSCEHCCGDVALSDAGRGLCKLSISETCSTVWFYRLCDVMLSNQSHICCKSWTTECVCTSRLMPMSDFLIDRLMPRYFPFYSSLLWPRSDRKGILGVETRVSHLFLMWMASMEVSVNIRLLYFVYCIYSIIWHWYDICWMMIILRIFCRLAVLIFYQLEQKKNYFFIIFICVYDIIHCL